MNKVALHLASGLVLLERRYRYWHGPKYQARNLEAAHGDQPMLVQLSKSEVLVKIASIKKQFVVENSRRLTRQVVRSLRQRSYAGALTSLNCIWK